MNSDSLQNAFRIIYEKESDAIFRFCLFRVSNREQSLDLTQQTFLRLWQTMQKGEKMTNARAFIFTVAHNLVIDWYRLKKPLSLENIFRMDEADDYVMPEVSDENDAMLEAEGRNLIELIDKLSISCRHAVYLRFVEGLPPPEIGKILGISSNAASVRVNRGIKELRKISGYDGNIKNIKERSEKSESKESQLT